MSSFTSHVEMMDKLDLTYNSSNKLSDPYMHQFEYSKVIGFIMKELEKTTSPTGINLAVNADEMLRKGSFQIKIIRTLDNGNQETWFTNELFIPHAILTEK